MNGQLLENPYAVASRSSIVICVLILSALLSVFVSPVIVAISLCAPVLAWLVFQRPTSVLGIFLALMPFEALAILVGRFFDLPLITVVSKSKEPLLLLLVLILWWRNGFRPAAPDWFLAGLLALAGIHKLLGGSFMALQDDFSFVLPYAAGRVAILTVQQEHLWARCAVWIAAIVSALGMIEVFFLGEGPRTLLYSALADVDLGLLWAPFHAGGFSGLREASTMIGPPTFAALCMIALIIWWVYCRNPIPASAIAAGLICSVTRAAWLGTAAAISLVAIMLGQQKRLLLYASLAVALFAAAIPVLGLSDYLFLTKTRQDDSAQGHEESILSGVAFIADHPLGAGPGSVGPRAFVNDANALSMESTYLLFAAQYGIIAALCFLGFLLSGFRLAWRNQSQLGLVAIGILVGLGLAMIVFHMHNDFRLECWAWFPVGLSIRTMSEIRASA
jgi:O-antigen ligase/polysaccharide polymerase Wzy-like membrane protein